MVRRLTKTNSDDRITANSYYAPEGTVSVKSGQEFIDEDGNLHTVTDIGTIAGKTLYPYVENLVLAANVHGGNYWTTFYCGHTGYRIDDEENAWAYTATVSGETVTLNKLGKVIPKNNAVILVGSDNSISMTASTAENTVSNDLEGVDVRTEKSRSTTRARARSTSWAKRATTSVSSSTLPNICPPARLTCSSPSPPLRHAG